jgi:hypothetical protein
MRGLLVPITFMFWVVACSRNDGADSTPDGAPDHAADSIGGVPPIDLLVVVHTVEWAATLHLVTSDAVPRRLVEPLVERGLDVRVGVISADLGSAGTVIGPTGRACGTPCDRADGTTTSDLGRLLTQPNCWRDGPTAAEWDRGDCSLVPRPEGTLSPYVSGADPALADWFSCLAVRTDGCRIAQPLESLYSALEPGTNPGFLRDGSVVVVVVVADGDDCSIADPRVFAEDGDIVPVGYTSKCAYRQEHLHPVSRYVQRLQRIRPAGRLVVAAFAGAPQDYRWCDPATPGGDDCGTCAPDRPCLPAVSCPSVTGQIVGAAPRLRDFATSFGTTPDGSPVGFSFGSCTLLPGAVEPTSDEALATVREAVLDRAGIDF